MIVFEKFGQHQPLNRQAERYALEGAWDYFAGFDQLLKYPFVGDVIDHLKIGRMALYRYFSPDRIRELRNQP
jgi:hypothetical protein